MNGIEQVESLFSGRQAWLCACGCGLSATDPLDVGIFLVDGVRGYYYATTQCVREAGYAGAIPFLETLERCGEPQLAALEDRVLSRVERQRWYNDLHWTPERALQRRAERMHPANWSDDEWESLFSNHRRLKEELGTELFEELVAENTRNS